MRNFKKLFAVIMAVAMLASIMVPALAADSFKYEDEAKKLNGLGLFKGISETSFDPDLGTALTRETGLALMIRAMGKDAEVQAMTKEDIAAQLAKVVDKETINVNWAEPYVAYAVKNGLTDGIDTSILPNIKFGANLPLSGKEFIFFMLKAMGYTKTDVPWDDVLNKAAEIGMLTPAQAVSFGNNPEIIRDDAVGIIDGSMVGTTAGGVTLAQKLVDDGVIAVDAMATAGYIPEPTATPTPTPVVLAVENVTADNLKEIVVTFNQDVDKTTAETAGNYTLSPSNAGALTPKLQDDGKTVIIKVGSNLANQGEYKLTIEKVKDSAGVAIAKTTKEFTSFDAVLPTITGMTVTGPKTFTLTFSEPMKAGTGSVTVKSANTTLAVQSAPADGTNKVTVTLYTELKDGVSYTVTTKDFEDFAGYKNVIKTEDLAYAKDNEVPAVTLESANQQYAVIKFNKPVKGLTAAHIYHTFSAWGPMGIYKTKADMDASANAITAATTDVTTVYVKFATDGSAGQHPMQPGDVNIHVLAKVGSDEVKDNWGNKFVETVLVATITSDVEAPEVATVEATGKSSIKVTYTKSVSNGGTVANYEVLNADGSKIDGLSFTTTVANDKKSVTLNLNKDLTGKDIVVNIKDVKDDTLQQNKMATYTTTITFGDKEFLGIDRAEFDATNKVLYVVYKEAMDDSAITIGNYKLLDGTTVRKLAGPISFFGGNKVVKIELSATEAGYVTANTDKMLIANVKDLAGNGSAAFQIEQLIVGIGTAAPGVVADGIKAIDKNTITIQFNQELVSIDPAEFELTVNGTDYVAPTALSSENNSKGTLVTLTFAATIPADLPAANVKVRATFTGDAGKTLNVFGVEPSDIAATTPIDRIVPAIAKTGDPAVNNIAMIDTSDDGIIDAIAITYNEKLDASKLSALSYEVIGRTISKVYPNATAAINATPAYATNEAIVVIELSTTGITAPATAALKVVQKLDLYDVIGNKLAAKTDELTAIDALAPMATVSATTGATNNVTTLVVTFSEPMYNNTTALYNGQDVKSLFTYDGTAANYVSATYDASNNSVTFTFTAAEDGKKLTAAATLKDVKGTALNTDTDVATYTAAGTIWALD